MTIGNTISLVITLGLVAVSAYLVIRVVTLYQAATGTVWNKLLATSRGSATIFTHFCVIVSGALVSSLDWIAQILNAPDVQSWIKAVITPTSVGAVMAGIAVITIVARLRTLGGGSSV
jgi:hypothetical protein